MAIAHNQQIAIFGILKRSHAERDPAFVERVDLVYEYRVLDYETERLFLQKVGGGYIFIPWLLLEHLAQMSVGQKNKI